MFERSPLRLREQGRGDGRSRMRCVGSIARVRVRRVPTIERLEKHTLLDANEVFAGVARGVSFETNADLRWLDGHLSSAELASLRHVSTPLRILYSRSVQGDMTPVAELRNQRQPGNLILQIFG